MRRSSLLGCWGCVQVNCGSCRRWVVCWLVLGTVVVGVFGDAWFGSRAAAGASSLGCGCFPCGGAELWRSSPGSHGSPGLEMKEDKRKKKRRIKSGPSFNTSWLNIDHGLFAISMLKTKILFMFLLNLL